MVVFSNKVFAEVPAPYKPEEQNIQKPTALTSNKEPISTAIQIEKKNTDTLEATTPPTPEAPPTPVKPNASETVAPPSAELSTIANEPEFPGGMSALRQIIMGEFNTAVLSGNGGLLKAEIYFNVNTDGTTSDFTVKGNNEVFNTEALRCVKNAAQSAKWKPATVDGNPAKYKFRMPLTMQFEPSPASKQ